MSSELYLAVTWNPPDPKEPHGKFEEPPEALVVALDVLQDSATLEKLSWALDVLNSVGVNLGQRFSSLIIPDATAWSRSWSGKGAAIMSTSSAKSGPYPWSRSRSKRAARAMG